MNLKSTKVMKVLEVQEYKTTVSRKPNRKLHADESRDIEFSIARSSQINVILDHLDSEFRKRCLSHQKVQNKLSVSTDCDNVNNREVRERSERLSNAYDSDVESLLDDEFVHFHEYFNEYIVYVYLIRK